MGRDGPPRTLPRFRLQRSQSTYVALTLFVLIVFAVSAFLYATAIRVEGREDLAQNDAVARSVAASIEAREQGYLNVLRSYAGRFRFRESVKRQDAREAVVHLRQLRQSFPELDRVFLADPAGIVWASEPDAPEIRGRSYAFRDWYRGVSRDWQPYMSEVYQTDLGRTLAVALVIPIRDDVDQKVIGVLASVQRLDVLREWLLPIQIPSGDLFVVDRKGQLVFHRTRAGAPHLADYLNLPVVRRLLEARRGGTEELENPVDGGMALTAYRWLPALGWGVVVQTQKDIALRRTRLLLIVSASVGLLLTGGLAALGGLALRNERRIAAALSKSSERLKVLHEIDRAIIAAESPAAIAEAVLPQLRDLLGVPRVIVNLFDWQAGEVEWLAAIGRRRLHRGPSVRYPLALAGDLAALRRGEVQVIDARTLPPSPAAQALLASGVDVYMVVPMVAGDELIGSVSFGGAPAAFADEQVSIAREVASQLAIALAHARLRERVSRQAEELEQRVAERTGELSAAKAEADGANRAKSDFLSRMSHELRTPLNAIIGFGQLLEMRVGEARDRESVEQILKGGRHLLNLINEILDISRIEAGRLSLSPEPVQVGEAFRRVLDLARPLAGSRGIQFDVDGGVGHERYVLADSQRLQQVLLNLISNAIKYNRDGGRVTLTCAPAAPGRLRLSIADTGAGIAADLRSRLFTPFDRLGAEAAGVEGTGLGLALSKRLVEVMGGEIGLQSVHDEGTVFWVDLAETTAPEERSALLSDRRPDPGAAARRRGTILYIEDNPSNLRLVERVLAEQSAVRFIPAMQGRLGLSLAREHRPDLILLDLHLPDMAGDEVLLELQRDQDLRHTPVVMLTADATAGQIKRLLAAGARAYLTKPLDVQQLLTQIDAVLAKP
jgi:signal transduction histidine kinase/CheY-like chemotaxis protein